MLFPTSASEHPQTDDAKHKHLPPKWTKQKNPWGFGLVMRVAKVLRVCIARAVEFNNGFTFSAHTI